MLNFKAILCNALHYALNLGASYTAGLASIQDLPSLAAVTVPKHDDLKYFMDDLPYPQSLPQELELWQVSIV